MGFRVPMPRRFLSSPGRAARSAPTSRRSRARPGHLLLVGAAFASACVAQRVLLQDDLGRDAAVALTSDAALGDGPADAPAHVDGAPDASGSDAALGARLDAAPDASGFD